MHPVKGLIVLRKGWGGRGRRHFSILGPFLPQEIFFSTQTQHFNEILHLEPNMRISHQEKGGKTHGHRNIGLPAHNGHGISVEVVQ
jgi:hypothetical protein